MIFPCVSGSPGSMISSPVARMATRGVGRPAPGLCRPRPGRQAQPAAKSLGGQDTFALTNILTTPPQVTAEARCPVNLHPRIAPIGVLDLHHRVGALWQRRSRHDFDRGAWGDAMTWTFASREDCEHLEQRRLVTRGVRHIRVAHRIAVHGGIVIQGNVALAVTSSAVTRCSASSSATFSTPTGWTQPSTSS